MIVQRFGSRFDKAIWTYFTLLAIAFAYNTWYLGLFSRWWYQDDPLQIYRVLLITNPVRIFTDPSILNNWGTGNALVPFQIFSYWIDVSLFGPHPFPIYVHVFFAFLVAAILVYGILMLCIKDRVLALGATILWMLLPSTMAVHQFISARHYMEGLICALAVVYIALYMTSRQKTPGFMSIVIVGVIGITGMLHKEVYATSIPTFLALVGFWRRRYSFVLLALGLTAVYTIYRLTFLGTNLTYTMDFVGPHAYLAFLAVLPYMFTSSPLGYFIYIGIAILAILSFRRNWREAVWPTIICVSIVSVTLLAVYPVTWAVHLTYRTPGTWYRIPFLINTSLVIYGTWMLSQFFGRSSRIAILSLVLVLILPSTEITRLQWKTNMYRAELEGRFYISNPDKLFYSEDDAPWFIYGVHELYDIPHRHYINKQYHHNDLAQQMIQEYDTLWRYERGHFVPDDTLFYDIVRENMLLKENHSE